MSPVLQARLRRFKNNRLGFVCFCLFMLIFIASLGANFIANERPLIVKYQSSLYFPVVKDYPETTFGGVFETTAEYRDPVVQNLINRHGWMLWPPIPYRYDTINYELEVPAPAPPSAKTGWAPMTRPVMSWPG